MPKRPSNVSAAAPMVITTVALPEDQHARLRRLAVDARKSLRDLIREAVDEYLKRHGKERG